MIYRRRSTSDVWHTNRECHQYPRKMTKKVYVRRKAPTHGELCDECRSLDKKKSEHE